MNYEGSSIEWGPDSFSYDRQTSFDSPLKNRTWFFCEWLALVKHHLTRVPKVGVFSV